MNRTKDGIEVQPGQIWRNLDKRVNGRTLMVKRVENGFAYMDNPRKSRISIRRMHKHATGWELVS